MIGPSNWRVTAAMLFGSAALMSNALATQPIATHCLQELEAAGSRQATSVTEYPPQEVIGIEAVVQSFEKKYLSNDQKALHARSILDVQSAEREKQQAAFRYLWSSELISARTKAAMLARVGRVGPEDDFEFELSAARLLAPYFETLGCSTCSEEIVARLGQSSDGLSLAPEAVSALYRLSLVTWNADVEAALLLGCGQADAESLDAVAVSSWDATLAPDRQDTSIISLVRAAAARGAADSAYLAFLVEEGMSPDSPTRSRGQGIPRDLYVAALHGSEKGRTALARRLLRAPDAAKETILVGRFLAASAADSGDARARIYVLNTDSTRPEVLKHWSVQIDEFAFAALTGTDAARALVNRLLAKQL